MPKKIMKPSRGNVDGGLMGDGRGRMASVHSSA